MKDIRVQQVSHQQFARFLPGGRLGVGVTEIDAMNTSRK